MRKLDGISVLDRNDPYIRREKASQRGGRLLLFGAIVAMAAAALAVSAARASGGGEPPPQEQDVAQSVPVRVDGAPPVVANPDAECPPAFGWVIDECGGLWIGTDEGWQNVG